MAVKLSCSQPLKYNILWLPRLFYKDSSTMPLSSIPIWIRLGSKKCVVFEHVLLHKTTQRVYRLSRHPYFPQPPWTLVPPPLTPLTTPPIIPLNLNLNAYGLHADKHKLNWHSTVLIFLSGKYLPFFLPYMQFFKWTKFFPICFHQYF